MKVVSELIRHFISKGALKPDQIRFLIEGGYLTASELYADHEGDEAPAAPVDHATEEAPEPPPRRRGRGGKRTPSIQIQTQSLIAWLEEQLPAWKAQASPLIDLARRVDKKADADTALVIIAKEKPDKLLAELILALQAKQPSLKSLWKSMALDELIERLFSNELRGPAGNAFRALLGSHHGQARTRLGWLLRKRGVLWVYQHSQAVSAICAAFAKLYSSQPLALAKLLRGEKCPPALLTLALFAMSRTRDSRNPPAVTVARFDQCFVDAAVSENGRLAAAASSSSVIAFDMRAGRVLSERSLPNTPVGGLAISPDGALAWSIKNVIRSVAPSGAERIIEPLRSDPLYFEFSWSDAILTGWNAEGEVAVWNLAKKTLLRRPVIRPNARWGFFITEELQIHENEHGFHIWEPASGKMVWDYSCTWTKCRALPGKLFAIGRADGMLIIWDAVQRKVVASINTKSSIDDLIPARRGSRIAVRTGPQVNVWDWATATFEGSFAADELLRAFNNGKSSLIAVKLATGIHVYDIDQIKRMATLPVLPTLFVVASPNGRFIAFAGGKTVAVWDWAAATESSHRVYHEDVTHVWFADDSALLVRLGDHAETLDLPAFQRQWLSAKVEGKHQVQVFDMVSGDARARLPMPGTRTLDGWNALVWIGPDELVATESNGRLVSNTVQEQGIAWEAAIPQSPSAVLYHDGSLFASTLGGTLWRIAVPGGEASRVGDLPTSARCLARSASGMLAAGMANGDIWLVGESETRRLPGLHRPVRSLAFDESGNRLICTSGHTMQLWDVASGEIIEVFEDTNPLLVGVTSDNGHLMSLSENGELRRWQPGARSEHPGEIRLPFPPATRREWLRGWHLALRMNERSVAPWLAWYAVEFESCFDEDWDVPDFILPDLNIFCPREWLHPRRARTQPKGASI